VSKAAGASSDDGAGLPVRFSVRKVRSLGARDGTGLAAYVPGRRWPAGGESVIDGDPGAPGQELVGEPVNVAFGLAGAGLSEQAGDFPEWDAAGIEQRREGMPSLRTRRVRWYPCRSWPAPAGG
jgi:hypothetical protein